VIIIQLNRESKNHVKQAIWACLHC
jgi:hypothetical protein